MKTEQPTEPTTHDDPEPSSMIPASSRASTNGSSAQNASNETPFTLHLVLQGKGGVGKTYIASLIAQYLQDIKRHIHCIDTDPVNASFCAVSELHAMPIRLLDRDRLDVVALDEMIDWILSAETDFVVDNGAASFLPLSRYLVENEVLELITSYGKRVVVHTVVTGGPALLETGKGLAAIVEQFPAGIDVVVWLNAFFGPVVTAAGEPFDRTPLYQQTRHRIAGLIRLEALDPDTAGHTLAQMLDRRLTFAQADTSAEFLTVGKRRLQQIKRRIWEQLAKVI